MNLVNEMKQWMEEVSEKQGKFVTIEGKPVFMGGPGAGGGGSATGGTSPFARPPGLTGGSFDEHTEQDALFIRKGQSSSFKPGTTREQAERYYKRRNAVMTAASTPIKGYRDRTVKTEVDRAIQSGKTNVTMQGRWTTLNDDSDQGMRFGDAASRNYIKTCLNTGDFAKNYETD